MRSFFTCMTGVMALIRGPTSSLSDRGSRTVSRQAQARHSSSWLRPGGVPPGPDQNRAICGATSAWRTAFRSPPSKATDGTNARATRSCFSRSRLDSTRRLLQAGRSPGGINARSAGLSRDLEPGRARRHPHPPSSPVRRCRDDVQEAGFPAHPRPAERTEEVPRHGDQAH